MTVTQLSVYIENKPGKLAEVISRLSAAEINIRALSLEDTSDFGLVRLIVSDAEKAKKLLGEMTLVSTNNVLAVEMADRSGALSDVLAAMDNQDVNVEYMYAFAGKQPLNAYVVMQVNNIAKAEEILQKNNIGTLCDADLLESLN